MSHMEVQCEVHAYRRSYSPVYGTKYFGSPSVCLLAKKHRLTILTLANWIATLIPHPSILLHNFQPELSYPIYQKLLNFSFLTVPWRLLTKPSRRYVEDNSGAHIFEAMSGRSIELGGLKTFRLEKLVGLSGSHNLNKSIVGKMREKRESRADEGSGFWGKQTSRNFSLVKRVVYHRVGRITNGRKFGQIEVTGYDLSKEPMANEASRLALWCAKRSVENRQGIIPSVHKTVS